MTVIGLVDSPEASGLNDSWIETPIRKASSVPFEGQLARGGRCSADRLVIAVKGIGTVRDACVFGGDGMVRLARYQSSIGSTLYAVAFRSEGTFTPVQGLCEDMGECAYSSLHDTLIMQKRVSPLWFGHVFVKDFTSYLKRDTEGSDLYRFTYTGGGQLVEVPTRVFATGAVSVSSNGRWVLVELHEYGFIRVDMQTLQFRRVAAPGATYGVGNDPAFELAISDDGRHIAVVGFRAGISVYEIDETCGDILEVIFSPHYIPVSEGCKQASIDRYALFQGFISAHEPRFTRDAAGLALYVETNHGVEYAFLASEPTVGFEATRYLALGDSFVSGEGEIDDTFYLPETNTSVNRCHVSSRAYPYLIGVRWGKETTNAACSGSRIQDVVDASKKQTGSLPGFISIGVGGNDADLMGKLKTCLGIGTCEWALPDRRIASLQEIRALLPRLIAMIDEMKRTFAGTTVLLIGYPTVINERADASCPAPLSALLNQTERDYVSEAVKYLNKVLREAANYTGTYFVDVENALVSERLCDATEAAMNGIRYGDDIAPIPFLQTIKLVGAESFHPTPRGHELIAATIAQKVSNSGGLPDCECTFNEKRLLPTEYWSAYVEAKWLDVQQARGDFLRASATEPFEVLPFSLPAATFAKNTSVSIEIHSTPRILGEYQAGNDGSLEGSFTIPDLMRGYHTVHVYGKSPSGQALDLYQVLYVGRPEFSGVSSIEEKRSLGSPSSRTKARSLTGNIKTKNAILGSKHQAPLKKESAKSEPMPESPLSAGLFIGGGVILVGVTIGAILMKMRPRVPGRGG